MFTGIVLGMGRVVAITPTEPGRRLEIEIPAWERTVAAGDSIAIDGCCLTVAEPPAGRRIAFDVIHQTLRLTTLGDLEPGAMVNLEPAALPTTALGGHLVQGHVDAVADVVGVDEAAGEYRLGVTPPAAQLPYIVERGSVTLNGVSLTVAGLDAGVVEVALIPTTLELTNLGRLAAGGRVNLETDYVAKIVVGYLRNTEAFSGSGTG